MSPDSIDLICIGHKQEISDWPLGRIVYAEPQPAALNEVVRTTSPETKALLFWDLSLGQPDVPVVRRAIASRGDFWHAGLKLGVGETTLFMDSVYSTWMLNCDADPQLESTSWRVSLRAALVPMEVLSKMGFLDPAFQTLEAATLDWAYRCITRGVAPRYLPWLIGEGLKTRSDLPPSDQLRLVKKSHGSFWAKWASMRAILNRNLSVRTAMKALRQISQFTPLATPSPFHRPEEKVQTLAHGTVSILIPTLDRYPYLRTLLSQLRNQTIPPLEILVVDQTAKARRDTAIAQDFADLPLKLIYRDQAGQCSSRNAGLQASQGDYILFLDDDSEVPPDLIEAHLRSLERFRADVSSGVADEVGAGPLPENFQLIRVSDVFPTNNTMMDRRILERSGLFDLAYERGQRADGDLGMRVYLSGALMVLNPAISILHHHAPQGGLRAHKARVITYASSRSKLFHRQLVSATEIYLCERYFSKALLREMLWLRVAGTFRIKGGILRKAGKFLISTLALPHTLYDLRRKMKIASQMRSRFPEIDSLAQPVAASEISARKTG